MIIADLFNPTPDRSSFRNTAPGTIYDKIPPGEEDYVKELIRVYKYLINQGNLNEPERVELELIASELKHIFAGLAPNI
jgi:hypothetical protein